MLFGWPILMFWVGMGETTHVLLGWDEVCVSMDGVWEYGWVEKKL